MNKDRYEWTKLPPRWWQKKRNGDSEDNWSKEETKEFQENMARHEKD